MYGISCLKNKFKCVNRLNGANESLVNGSWGPSLLVYTACSASLSATTLAMNDMRLGNIDPAIVCGTHMLFEPFVLQFQQESGLCSPRGVAAILDQNADGFIKGEAMCCAFLQHRRDARRVYATMLKAKMNIDGNKTTGMFFPLADAQQELMIDTYSEVNVNPLDLTYFEAHCTGTKAGDPREIKAIYNANVKAPGRTQPLPLGALKSNMGHAEAGSGVAALIKVCIAYENECIPPNLNMKQLKDECLPYCPPIKPIVGSMPYKPGLAAVSNFGIGGANAHVLLEPNHKLGTSDGLRIAETILRIVNICGRTEDAVEYVMDFIQINPKRVTNDFLALLAQTMKYTPNVNSSGMPFKGSLIIKRFTENNKSIPKGLMVVVRLPKSEAQKLCPNGVYNACNNAKNSLVISGLEKEMKETIKVLAEKNIFPRSKKWLSTSLMIADPTEEALRYASGGYFAHNLLNPVQFYDRIKQLPADAIVLEIGPHSLAKYLPKRSMSALMYRSLKRIQTTRMFLATLYELGVNMFVDKLYPCIEWPVVRDTQAIYSVIKWDLS
ncbi:unnamed protein product [Medioppia subpectinata]|uniref:Ketosynthase family 3 (KS3) domain-containing protein n=1 Tax=Medioppia subpectinata TaxID=1979941 RepID=A0A7R9KK78_9ACAR|nr:unnamed protein product [Medioppia subpectinata]CAG2105232.1 unnamed protein product [Medioppia subpectinata]